jgi:hypothetical protein
MRRTTATLFRDGLPIAQDVAVKIRTELGFCSGHITLATEHTSALSVGEHTLRFSDDQEMSVVIQGVSGQRAYFSAREFGGCDAGALPAGIA